MAQKEETSILDRLGSNVRKPERKKAPQRFSFVRTDGFELAHAKLNRNAVKHCPTAVYQLDYCRVLRWTLGRPQFGRRERGLRAAAERACGNVFVLSSHLCPEPVLVKTIISFCCV